MNIAAHKMKEMVETGGHGNGSEDLFSSQSSSQQSLIHEQLDITMQLTEYVWVQCDNPDCQKWRRVYSHRADKLGDSSWYCRMNEDTERNTCLADEEDTALYDRMARKAGIKYVMSVLEVGAMVWAKVPGYCRWPGIVSRCPDTGVHVWVDIDGDPVSYHIEFLGRPPSHCWVPTKSVEVYGHRNKDKIDRSQGRKNQTTKQKSVGRRHKMKLTEGSQSRLRKRYKHTTIDDLISEADFLLRLSPVDRLNHTHFKYKPPAVVQLPAEAPQSSSVKKKQQAACSNCANKERGKQNRRRKYQHKQSIYLSPTNMQTQHVQQGQKQSVPEREKDVYTFREMQDADGPCGTIQARKEPSRHVLVQGGKENRITSLTTPKLQQSVFSSVLNSYSRSVDEGISVASVKTEASASDGFDSPNQFSQSQLKFQNSMVNKSKEEKFTIDIGMYSKNEKAFEHDVRRFMSRHGERIKSTPVWNNVPIRLFQLFLAVYERGGFKQTTKKKQWTSVYRELTEQHFAKSGLPAKKYYERNLYPYEAYISGEDVKSLLQKKTAGPKVKPATARTVGQEHEASNVEILSDQDLDSYTRDIEAILGQLDEECNSVGTKSAGHVQQDLETPATAVAAKEKMKEAGVEVKFHDQSTGSPSFQFGSAGSEFNAFLSAESVNQEVPEMDTGDLNLASVEDKILHEMKALEKDMKEVIDHLDSEQT